MKVLVQGKEKLKGTSKKTGQPFDATLVHVSYDKKGCEGVACDSIFVSTDICDFSDIIVGEVYHADYDSRGYMVGFTME